MLRTKITSKGQVTIPVEVRRELGLHPGDELVFQLQGDELLVRGIKRRSLTELRGGLPAVRPFPGRDQVRAETAREIGRRLVPETAATKVAAPDVAAPDAALSTDG